MLLLQRGPTSTCNTQQQLSWTLHHISMTGHHSICHQFSTWDHTVFVLNWPAGLTCMFLLAAKHVGRRRMAGGGYSLHSHHGHQTGSLEVCKSKPGWWISKLVSSNHNKNTTATDHAEQRNLPKTDHTERGKIGRAADSKPPSVWVALSKYHHRNTVSMQTEITCQHTATRTQLMSGTPFWLLWQHGLRSSKGAQSRSGEDLLTGDGGWSSV